MNLAYVRKLLAYDEWANRRFFEAVGAVTEQQLAAPVVSSFPSLGETLAHIVAVEWLWLRRWQGDSPGAFPSWSSSHDVALLRARLTEVETERERFLSGLTDADVERTVNYHRLQGEPRSDALADLVVHVVNHSTYHRGQLTTLLRQAGGKPPATDFFIFARNPQ